MGKEMCVICLKPTEYEINTHVDQRQNYIQGVGQLCNECADDLNADESFKKVKRQEISRDYGIE